MLLPATIEFLMCTTPSGPESKMAPGLLAVVVLFVRITPPRGPLKMPPPWTKPPKPAVPRATLSLTVLFPTYTKPAPRRLAMPPPKARVLAPPPAAVLRLTVLRTRITVPMLAMPPPADEPPGLPLPALAEFESTVVVVMVRKFSLKMPPPSASAPSPPPALLPMTAEFVTYIDPRLLL